MKLPDPEQRPTITVAEAGEHLGLSRSAAYQAARNGTIPVIKISPRRWLVPTASFRAMLGLDPNGGGANSERESRPDGGTWAAGNSRANHTTRDGNQGGAR